MIRANNLTRSRNWRTSATLLTACVFSIGMHLPAAAGTFMWGDVSDPSGDVMFLDVTETNSEADALFAPNPGSGSPTASGNNLLLDPQNFLAEAPSGGGIDFIDSTLTTTIMAKPGSGIDNVQLNEFGDFSLFGGGVANTGVGAALFVTVLEVDGAPLLQDVQSTNLIVTTGAGANGGEYSLPGDSGLATIWEGEAFFDVAGFLASEAISGQATKVRVRFDNALSAYADGSSIAFIKKKEGGVIIRTNVPEPATATLSILALAGACAVLRSRKQATS